MNPVERYQAFIKLKLDIMDVLCTERYSESAVDLHQELVKNQAILKNEAALFLAQTARPDVFGPVG